MEQPRTRTLMGIEIQLRHFTLTLLLFGLLISRPFLPHFVVDATFVVTMMISAWLMGTHSRRTLIAVIVLGLSTFACLAANILLPAHVPSLLQRPIGYALVIMLFVSLFYCGLTILGRLLKTTRLTADEIIGTINFYLILGFLWAYGYYLLQMYDPNSFNVGASGNGLDPNLVYFSFVTLTTLGYGDITPLSSVAQMLAIVEAIIGQFYVAVVVSYLLGVYITQKLNPESGIGD